MIDKLSPGDLFFLRSPAADIAGVAVGTIRMSGIGYRDVEPGDFCLCVGKGSVDQRNGTHIPGVLFLVLTERSGSLTVCFCTTYRRELIVDVLWQRGAS